MTQLYEIKVSLSPNQKKNLSNAYHKRETIVLRLAKDSLTGNDTLYVPSNVVKRLEKNHKLRKGMDIKLAKTNIRKQVGGSLLTSILTLGRTLAPTLGKTLGLSALAGLASEGASQVVKKIAGKGVQSGGFLIPQNKIDQLIAYKHLLTDKQKRDILNSVQSGGQLLLKPTKSQYGGFLGTLLASIGIPLAIEALKKITGGAPRMGSDLTKGHGAPRMGSDLTKGHGAPRIGMYQPPPFIGTWEQARKGGGKKKKKKSKKTEKIRSRTIAGKKQSIQKRTSLKHSIVKPKFHKKIPMSNYDLLDWCKYLNIPINNVLSREESSPHNHMQALFIYNLEPSYMSGSHWVATYVKNGIINYFDSFGMPPFQEIVNHAKRTNMTLLHQSDQIQNLLTTTCGYFCLYFLNEMSKGRSYYDLLKVFNSHNTKENEKYIENYFKII